MVGTTNSSLFLRRRKEDFVVAENIEDALKLAREKNSNSKLETKDLRQDVDALDTWFSSWLWPMSVLVE
jgi:valyl-tRNA synthetase